MFSEVGGGEREGEGGTHSGWPWQLYQVPPAESGEQQEREERVGGDERGAEVEQALVVSSLSPHARQEGCFAAATLYCDAQGALHDPLPALQAGPGPLSSARPSLLATTSLCSCNRREGGETRWKQAHKWLAGQQPRLYGEAVVGTSASPSSSSFPLLALLAPSLTHPYAIRCHSFSLDIPKLAETPIAPRTGTAEPPPPRLSSYPSSSRSTSPYTSSSGQAGQPTSVRSPPCRHPSGPAAPKHTSSRSREPASPAVPHIRLVERLEGVSYCPGVTRATRRSC